MARTKAEARRSYKAHLLSVLSDEAALISPGYDDPDDPDTQALTVDERVAIRDDISAELMRRAVRLSY